MKKIGTIALDVDGTITTSKSNVPKKLIELFVKLEKKWHFIFLTGREFSFAMEALSKFPFPYYLAVQNGADIIEMPSMKKIVSNYISKAFVLEFQKMFQVPGRDPLIYSGFDKGDFCYYRPEKLAEKSLEDIAKFKRENTKPWKQLADFSEIDQTRVSMIKVIGKKEELKPYQEALSTRKDLCVSLIVNPKDPSTNLLLITGDKASKNQAYLHLESKNLVNRPLLAAGDDDNDIKLLKIADVSIAMETGPADLLEVATLIAKSSKEEGLIDSLSQAVNTISSSNEKSH